MTESGCRSSLACKGVSEWCSTPVLSCLTATRSSRSLRRAAVRQPGADVGKPTDLVSVAVAGWHVSRATQLRSALNSGTSPSGPSGPACTSSTPAGGYTDAVLGCCLLRDRDHRRRLRLRWHRRRRRGRCEDPVLPLPHPGGPLPHLRQRQDGLGRRRWWWRAARPRGEPPG